MKHKLDNADAAMAARHRGFERGRDSMHMSNFERDLVAKEEQDRKDATERYVRGIQGVDGGRCQFGHM